MKITAFFLMGFLLIAPISCSGEKDSNLKEASGPLRTLIANSGLLGSWRYQDHMQGEESTHLIFAYDNVVGEGKACQQHYVAAAAESEISVTKLRILETGKVDQPCVVTTHKGVFEYYVINDDYLILDDSKSVSILTRETNDPDPWQMAPIDPVNDQKFAPRQDYFDDYSVYCNISALNYLRSTDKDASKRWRNTMQALAVQTGRLDLTIGNESILTYAMDMPSPSEPAEERVLKRHIAKYCETFAKQVIKNLVNPLILTGDVGYHGAPLLFNYFGLRNLKVSLDPHGDFFKETRYPADLGPNHSGANFFANVTELELTRGLPKAIADLPQMDMLSTLTFCVDDTTTQRQVNEMFRFALDSVKIVKINLNHEKPPDVALTLDLSKLPNINGRNLYSFSLPDGLPLVGVDEFFGLKTNGVTGECDEIYDIRQMFYWLAMRPFSFHLRNAAASWKNSTKCLQKVKERCQIVKEKLADDILCE